MVNQTHKEIVMAIPSQVSRRFGVAKQVNHLLGWLYNSNTDGAANGATVSALEFKHGPISHTRLTLTATPVTITDDAGVAQYGGCGKIYDFPAGQLQMLGATVVGNLTLGTTGTIINTFGSSCALGSATATTGATLTGTEADIMAQTAGATAVTKVAAYNAMAPTVLPPLDGRASAKDMYLNFVVTDDATHTSGTGTFTGVVDLWWMNLTE